MSQQDPRICAIAGKVSECEGDNREKAENVVTPKAIRRFARFRDRILEQIIEVSHDEEENDSFR